MKITRGFKVGGFFLAATFSAGLGFGTIASAQVTHSYLVDLNRKTVTDIGTLDGTDLSTDARGINDAGQVVGSSGIWRRFPGFHHRPGWDGHERPWHLRWCSQLLLMASARPGR